MKGAFENLSHYFSNDTLPLLYSLGGSSPDMHRDGDMAVSIVVNEERGTSGLVGLVSRREPYYRRHQDDGYFTGFQQVLAGTHNLWFVCLILQAINVSFPLPLLVLHRWLLSQAIPVVCRMVAHA